MDQEIGERLSRWCINIGIDGNPQSPPMAAVQHIKVLEGALATIVVNLTRHSSGSPAAVAGVAAFASAIIRGESMDQATRTGEAAVTKLKEQS